MRRAPPNTLPGLVEPGQKPVRPKDSASLIVLRRTGDGLDVLMGRRGKKAVFGGVYVFPGGKVDAADRRVGFASDLQPHDLKRISKDERRARGFPMAAVREAFEETGLLLADRGELGPTQHPSWSEIGGRGLAPDLGKLGYVGHAITPSKRRFRFNARFFFAWEEHMSGTLGGSGELADLDYFPLDEALKLPLVDVTEFMLLEIKRRAAEKLAPRETYPFFSYRTETPYIRYS
ncbi:NUDIX hydrolase [Nisaea sp.]|uniref:NUDIX hydrolase n=1 Tax=Nisaea sp. TaxID=2024842 RepID=UPI003B52031B